MAEENGVREIIESSWWKKFTGAEGARFGQQGAAEREALAHTLIERLSDEIRMQLHEWYWEEMRDVFPPDNLESLLGWLVGSAQQKCYRRSSA